MSSNHSISTGVCISLAAVLSMLAVGEVRAQQPAQEKPKAAIALESIRLDPLFPSTSDLPAFGKLKWHRMKGTLVTDAVHEKNRAVSSGMYYISYVELTDMVKILKRQLRDAKESLQGVTASHEGRLAQARWDLAYARVYMKKYQDRPKSRERYEKKAEVAQEKIDYLSNPETLADSLKSARGVVEGTEKSLVKIEKKSPQGLFQHNLFQSAIFQVISGIRYMENPDEWLKAIEGYDPLFQNANSAGVGEYSILSPKKHFYDVRFKRGQYVVSLMVTRGTGDEKLDVGIHKAGRAIALAFDRALTDDVPGISIEENPRTKHPYVGLVADGTNILKISVSLPELMGTLAFEQPKLGVLQRKAGKKWETIKSGSISLAGNGKASLRYRPQDYIKGAALETWTPIHPKGEPEVRYAEEMLRFRYTTKEGKEEIVDLPIRVFRPPVVFVHGFTGGLDTWKKLDEELTGLLWDTQRSEYYFREQNVADQAVLLRANIQNTKLHYWKSNVKIKKVDVVVHSMGGLITRYYISLSGKYEDDVRKLIMVATPNHGCNLTEKYLGNAASFFAGAAHSKAANDLHENSSVITRLNLQEPTGGHLDPDVQYAVLFGRRHNYWIWKFWARDSYFPNDGVVSVDSALLNGVVAYRFDGCLHTGGIKAVYPRDNGICEYGPVFDRVKTLLLADIPRVGLANSNAILKKTTGSVQCFRTSWKGGVRGESVRRKGVKTGSDGMAEIHFMQNGGLFAKLSLKPDTEVRIFAASHRFVRIYLYKGRARFTSAAGEKSSVLLMAGKGSNDLKFYPTVKTIHLDTDYEIGIVGDDVQVYSHDGRVAVEYVDKAGKAEGKALSGGEGLALVGGTELVEMNNPPKKKPITAPKTGIQEPVAPPAGKKPVGSPTQKMKLILSDRPLASATGGDGVYETTVSLYGRCSWQGAAPSALLDVRLFRDKSPNPVLTMPLLVPPADHTLDFSIPPRPRGWGEGLYSLRIMSGGQVLVETSFEIKTRKK